MCQKNSLPINTPTLDYFDQIYIINLEFRKDRLAEMSAEFGKIGIDFHHPKINVFKAIRPESFEDWPTQGAKGCYLSHIAVLKDARKNGYERIIVLEDDVNFVQYFNILMDETIQQLKKTTENGKPWDIFYGGHRVKNATQKEMMQAYKQNKLFSQNLFKPTPETEIYCLHFIALTKQIIPKTIIYLETIMSKPMGDPTGGRMHADGAYNWFRNTHKDALVLMAYPQLGFQRSSRTDIHTLRWFDRLPLFKVAVTVARKIKNSVYTGDSQKSKV